MREILQAVIVMTIIVMVAGCSKPTNHQELAAKYDSCMEQNKSLKVCENEADLVVQSYDEVREKLAIKLCPTETQEWETAKDGVRTAKDGLQKTQIYYDMSTGYDLPTSERRQIMLERDKAEVKKLEAEIKELNAKEAIFKCLEKAEPRLFGGLKVENKYLRSGQAERDAGLVK
jgi:ferredoxin-like protein FixX